MTKHKKLTKVQREELAVAAESLVNEHNLRDTLERLHLLFDMVCLVETQLTDDTPEELSQAVWHLRDLVGDHIAETIRKRTRVTVAP